MVEQNGVEEFFKALAHEREENQRQLLQDPENERRRLRWIEFYHEIEAAWLPIMDEFLTVLGKLWFGNVMRLKGSLFRKELVSSPAYVVAHRIYGPMAIFWVAEDNWQEKDFAFREAEGKAELRTGHSRRGYRCRITLQGDGEYHFQDDANNTLIQFAAGHQLDRQELHSIFLNAYIAGPQVIFFQWKTTFDEGDG